MLGVVNSKFDCRTICWSIRRNTDKYNLKMSMSHLTTLIDEIFVVVVLATGEQSRSPKHTLNS